MPREAVLGIDAAWTDRQPSGVALLRRDGSKWECLRVAPSYTSFCEGVNWEERVSGSVANVPALLAVAQRVSGEAPLVVAVDMPLANTIINARRAADNAVSRAFGHCKCAVHSPTPARPGKTGRYLHAGFAAASYSLSTQLGDSPPALLEVYPHVALLGLTGLTERLPYKVGKSNTYWRGISIDERKPRLLEVWALILKHLGREIKGINLPLSDSLCEHSLSSLKRYEDAIDALVCAWVATQYLDKASVPLGDNSAAIWIPSTAMQFAKEIHGT
jgi:predicted RNase H-like nuclease